MLPRGDIHMLDRSLQARSRGCVQTKTSEGGRLGMRAAYNNFAPTGGSYQSVFRGTLPRRCSIRRSQCGNTSNATCNQSPTSALFHPQTIAVFPISRLISKIYILIFIFAKSIDFPFSLCYTFNFNIVLTLTFFIIVCQTS